jgi:hypothetical protein
MVTCELTNDDKRTLAPAAPRYNRGGTHWVKRLNRLLRFAHQNLGVLNNGAWEDLLDELYEAIFGAKRNRDAETNFNRIATRESVREAQKGLDGAIRGDSVDDDITFELAKQTLTIHESKDAGFFFSYHGEHFPTAVYTAFAHLLAASWVRRSDFRLCANDKCGYPFVPLRKPRKGQPGYCSPKCANRMAAIKYRRSKGEALRAKERERAEKRSRGKSTGTIPKHESEEEEKPSKKISGRALLRKGALWRSTRLKKKR